MAEALPGSAAELVARSAAGSAAELEAGSALAVIARRLLRRAALKRG